MKFENKKNLTFQDGYITDKNGTIMNVPCYIVNFFNELEETKQLIEFKKNAKKPEEVESFKFKSMYEEKDFSIEKPETPLHDEHVAEAMKLMNETDEVTKVDKVNDLIKANNDALKWIDSDTIQISESDSISGLPCQFDTLTLGNPLKVSVDDVKAIWIEAASVDMDD